MSGTLDKRGRDTVKFIPVAENNKNLNGDTEFR
jgi:hypothetical protein